MGDLTTWPSAAGGAWVSAASVIVFLYVIAALFNLFIPRTEAVLQPLNTNVMGLVRDFSHCNARLWGDRLGQISLATTTMFWGVGGNMRIIVFPWAAVALGYSTTQASSRQSAWRRWCTTRPPSHMPLAAMMTAPPRRSFRDIDSATVSTKVRRGRSPSAAGVRARRRASSSNSSRWRLVMRVTVVAIGEST